MSDQPTANERTVEQVAAEAIGRELNGPASDGRGWYRTAAEQADCARWARAVLADVEPLIRAQAAEQIAQAIEADDGFEHRYERDYAARIARNYGKEG